jgi:chromosome partitioning protein
MDESYLDKVLLPSIYETLHVIPSNRDLAGAEVELVKMEGREGLLRARLEPLREYYDYIIIDCAPSLGLLTVNALVAADRAIIPVQCEYFALEGIAGLVQTLTQVKDHLNPNLEIGGIVLTMFDKRTSLNKQVVDNTRRFFKSLVFNTIVPRNIRLTEAPSHGIPISLYDASSTGAIAYKSLAEEVMLRV